ncbi:MAG: type IV secretion system protein [Campylobacteraceae bacterium]|jgi:type IV secretion system protein VirB6|nr:type IV secretion system protein [Campylobacteraceae bacterium]
MLFTNIEKIVTEVVINIFDKNSNPLISKVYELQTILVTSITIYIMYKAYLIWAGKIQDPVRDVIWDLGTKAVIINLKLYKRILS